MRGVLLASLRANAARLVASVLAVVIAVAFVVATLVLLQTSRDTVLRVAGAPYVDADLVVSTTDGESLLPALDAVTAVPGVRALAPTWTGAVRVVLPGRTGSQYLQVDAVADDPALRWQQLSAGRLPTGPGEIALTAQDGLAVGDVLPVTSTTAAGGTVRGEATVTGLVDLSGDVTSKVLARGFTTVEQARSWGADDPTELRIAGTPDRAALQAALGTRAASVLTGQAAAAAAASQLLGGTTELGAVLLVFATVAVLVAGLVIANTFAVLLAQRTQELALLRCVGATARQVRRSVLAEALVTGLAASALGVLVGTGLAAGVAALAAATGSPVPLAGVSVPWTAVVAGLVVGTVVTVVATLAPARAATRVAPLAALRPVDAAPLRSRSGVGRLVLGLLLLVPGVVLLAAGALRGEVLLALAGGALSFLAVVLLAQRAVPPVVAGAGRVLGRVGGVPARLAAGNATRNPRRTAATATALLIGVTLTTAMVVGASTTRATAAAGLDTAYPTDVVVQGYGTQVPASLLGTLAAVDGVQDGVAVATGQLTGPDGYAVQVDGFDAPATTAVLRSTTTQPLPAPGEAVLPPGIAQAYGVRTGAPVTFTADGRSLTLTAVVGSTDVQASRLTVADLATLVPQAPVGQLWLRLSDGADAAAVAGRLSDVVGTVAPEAVVTGPGTERAALDSLLDAVLLVVTGLLAVAVLIALIGVGNTLALSVVERRRETGLLRAVGLTRRQLRGLLAWEAALVSGVAAVLGVLLGGAYGVAGAASLLGGSSADGTVLSVPWLQVAAIVVVATGAGLLASVLPGRRAARTSPVAAISG